MYLIFLFIYNKIKYMIKIWGKVYSKERLIKSKTIKVDTQKTTFFDMLASLCQTLNIPTPVLLDKHVYDFNLFNHCTFKPDDFIEDVVFESFIVQYVGD